MQSPDFRAHVMQFLEAQQLEEGQQGLSSSASRPTFIIYSPAKVRNQACMVCSTVAACVASLGSLPGISMTWPWPACCVAHMR